MEYLLFHAMASLYVICRHVFSEWRSTRPVEINQYGITMDTHYDITMGNDAAREAHYEIIMSNDVATYTYHGITMHNNVVMNLFYYLFSALCLIVLFYYR